jgi:hypothetical protein
VFFQKVNLLNSWRRMKEQKSKLRQQSEEQSRVRRILGGAAPEGCDDVAQRPIRLIISETALDTPANPIP